MSLLATFFVLLVAVEHFYIMVLEMFLLSSKSAKRTFGLTEEAVSNPQIRTLFANQGLYNGFLAAGLIFGLILDSPAVQLYFLGCVIVAALYGAATANVSILFKQGLPAIIAFLLVLFV
ncbi:MULTISPECIES: DUF1304 domain-containing protein [Exiguobacterium]|uniref:DUF1304 domain-containing protein n=1 Tax=Exiguobacterium TaxID=33986 RepID=UPI00047BEB32|nr:MULTISPECIES: DUF1304 domain-containing protein [Exiguobacterium]MCK2156532.1 DUF1304 domain-containing protein [Exiguobacterium sp. 17-1]